MYCMMQFQWLVQSTFTNFVEILSCITFPWFWSELNPNIFMQIVVKENEQQQKSGDMGKGVVIKSEKTGDITYENVLKKKLG